LELYACEFCELCVQVCPTDAIVMMKSFDMATADRRELLLDKDRLHAIGQQFPVSWATGNRLRDMQAPPKKAAGRSTAEARHDARSRGLLGLRHRARRVRAGRRAEQEPVPLGALARPRIDGTAGVFLLLNAEFLAAVQILCTPAASSRSSCLPSSSPND
jgi:ferredoxin